MPPGLGPPVRNPVPKPPGSRRMLRLEPGSALAEEARVMTISLSVLDLVPVGSGSSEDMVMKADLDLYQPA